MIGLGHLEIGARDLDSSCDFYVRHLGFTPARFPATSGRWLANGDFYLHLIDVGAAGHDGGWRNDDLQVGVRHCGFKVADIDATAARLRAAGVEFLSDPTDVLGGVRICFFLDPSGVRWELMQGDLVYQQVGVIAAPVDRLSPSDPPRFDHFAVTVRDLEQSLDFYCGALGFELLGNIRHWDDERGFLMTYLSAGSAVLEIFSFDVPVDDTPRVFNSSLNGFRAIGLMTESSPADLAGAGAQLVEGDPGNLFTDPNGVRLLMTEPERVRQ